MAGRGNGGRLPMWQLLRCRVRYFTEGGVLGSQATASSTENDRDLARNGNQEHGRCAEESGKV
ncbi:MAG: hypothetical protein KDN22_27530 [Verrucomicrobiae bacterium]|nr:hypothetical protein [Verrucomicrobiae bacterium]